jgi:hypothetical protein
VNRKETIWYNQYTSLKDMFDLSRSNNQYKSYRSECLGLNKSNLPFSFLLFLDKQTSNDFFLFFFFGGGGGGGGEGEGGWLGGIDMAKTMTFYLDSSCKDLFPNNPNNVSSISLPWPCRNIRSCYHQEAINNGGNSFPTCKHNIWVIV